MKCTNPLYMVDYGLDSSTNKHIVKMAKKHPDDDYFSLYQKYGRSLISVPCGKCLACRINYTKEWSVRCMLEASLYKENWFITLTYDDEHLPDDHKIHKDHIQEFIKKLRYYSPGLRFFCCGEYGSNNFTHRPHYHLILFNCHIDDLKCISKGRLGGFYYDSKLIAKIWSKGQITIGDVTPNSCEYVARYCLKKVNGDEFVMMSLKPGIGGQYALDHYETIYDTDGVYLKGRKLKVPRYFDKLLERSDPDLFSRVKKSRDIPFSRFNLYADLTQLGIPFVEQLYDLQSRTNLKSYKDKMEGRTF